MDKIEKAQKEKPFNYKITVNTNDVIANYFQVEGPVPKTWITRTAYN